uniref:hypothetical protein n=1 Tax=Gelidibacter sp. TaxID=2018083 RepID=UPI00404A91D4
MKNIRKSAESAMANFLPIEEFKIPLISMKLVFNTYKSTPQDYYRQNLVALNSYLESF